MDQRTLDAINCCKHHTAYYSHYTINIEWLRDHVNEDILMDLGSLFNGQALISLPAALPCMLFKFDKPVCLYKFLLFFKRSWKTPRTMAGWSWLPLS